MRATTIEWTESTYNVVEGCTKISPECERCYAASMAARFSAPERGGKKSLYYSGIATRSPVNGTAQWTGDVRLRPEVLKKMYRELARTEETRKQFLCSMGDIGHEGVPDVFLDDIFATIAVLENHDFQVLSKRPGRLAAYTNQADVAARVAAKAAALDPSASLAWPLPNVWLGTSAGSQATADKFVPALLSANAEIRFLSCEPMLGPVDLRAYLATGKLHWVIVGGESEPGARRLDLAWVRDIVEQGLAARVPVFVKQLGRVWQREAGFRSGKGNDWDKWPPDLRVRQFPARGVASSPTPTTASSSMLPLQTGASS